MSGGKLIGIGVGPGDPELLTLKGLARLQESQVIAYPTLDSRPAFTRRIVATYLQEGQEELPLVVPLLRAETIAEGESASAQAQRHQARSQAYDSATELLRTKLQQGLQVALLCEGDPMFYGSFIYFHERLAGTWQVEIVPGVSSIMATAARLGSPLACGDAAFLVLPGTLAPSELHLALGRLKGNGCAVLKPNRHWTQLTTSLQTLGLLPRARVVCHATLEEERVFILAEEVPEAVPYFSILLIDAE